MFQHNIHHVCFATIEFSVSAPVQRTLNKLPGVEIIVELVDDEKKLMDGSKLKSAPGGITLPAGPELGSVCVIVSVIVSWY